MKLSFLFLALSLVMLQTGLSEEREHDWKPIVSSDSVFETHSTSEGTVSDINGNPVNFGEILYVRAHGTGEMGLPLHHTNRYLKVEWGPHSHLLAVEDHNDGHASEIYVYEISLEKGNIQAKLVYHSPDNDYDVHWTIEGWDIVHRTILLQRAAYRDATEPGVKKIRAKIGTFRING